MSTGLKSVRYVKRPVHSQTAAGVYYFRSLVVSQLHRYNLSHIVTGVIVVYSERFSQGSF